MAELKVTDQSKEIIDGVTNELALKRLIQSLVTKCHIPQGRYDLTEKKIEQHNDHFLLTLDFLLPEDRPVKRGTAVVGGAVHLKVFIVSTELWKHMNLSIETLMSTPYTGDTSQYIIYGKMEPDPRRAGHEDGD